MILCRFCMTEKKPDVVHYVLRLSTDFLVDIAKHWRDMFSTAGVFPKSDGVLASTLISHKQFEEFGLPYIKKLHEKVLGMGFKHIWCLISGDHNLNLPYWVQVLMGELVPGVRPGKVIRRKWRIEGYSLSKHL